MSEQAEQRKLRSMRLLQEQGIPYIEWLPFIGNASEVNRRTKEEILRRALATYFSIQVSYDLKAGEDLKVVAESRALFSHLLKRYSVEDDLLGNEILLFKDGETFKEIDLINMSWKYETLWVLFWFLGFVDDISTSNYQTLCDVDKLTQIIKSYPDFSSFLQAAQLRELDELLDQVDLLYRIHWAVVDAQLKQQAPPAGLNPGVVYERRLGAEWLISYEADWANLSLDT